MLTRSQINFSISGVEFVEKLPGLSVRLCSFFYTRIIGFELFGNDLASTECVKFCLRSICVSSNVVVVVAAVVNDGCCGSFHTNDRTNTDMPLFQNIYFELLGILEERFFEPSRTWGKLHHRPSAR